MRWRMLEKVEFVLKEDFDRLADFTWTLFFKLSIQRLDGFRTRCRMRGIEGVVFKRDQHHLPFAGGSLPE